MHAQPSTTPDAKILLDAEATKTEVLIQDLARQKDLHLRLAADFENFKRRNREEVEIRAAAQKELFIVELLPVIDNLERHWLLVPPSTPRNFVRESK